MGNKTINKQINHLIPFFYDRLKKYAYILQKYVGLTYNRGRSYKVISSYKLVI